MDDTTSGTSAVADAPASPSPAPSSPVASPSVSTEKPSSFAEALTARLAAPVAAEPGESKPASDQPVAAIAQPPQTEIPPVETVPTPDTKGPIPFERHESILKNARAKTEAEVSQRFQQQYAPHVELGQKFQADPVGTAVQVIRELGSHPEFGPLITSELARMLGARRGQTAPETDQEPQADLQTADGTLVYSAEQLAKREAWARKQLMSEVDQRLQPLQTREQQAQAQERYTAATKDASDRMSKVLAPFQQLPEFQEHKPAIAAKVKTLLEEGVEPGAAVGLAFTQVLRETVLPSRTAQSQQQLVSQAVAKSIGSTSGPGAAPAAPAGRPKSFEDAFGRVRV